MKEQLFLLGGLAIAVGVFTYSKKVMFTVGNDLLKMSPVAAFIVVISHSIVLFLFASQGISNFLQSVNLPSIPLVPVSLAKALIGCASAATYSPSSDTCAIHLRDAGGTRRK